MTMRKIVRLFIKYIIMVVVIIAIDVILRYIIEQAGIVKVIPQMMSYDEGKHLGNIWCYFIWVLLLISPLYLLFLLAYQFTVKKLENSSGLVRVLISSIWYFLAATFYVLLSDWGRSDVLLMSALVAIPVGVVTVYVSKALDKAFEN